MPIEKTIFQIPENTFPSPTVGFVHHLISKVLQFLPHHFSLFFAFFLNVSDFFISSPSCLLFSGHGNLTPQTSEGKIVTMLYALIGVPLMLMCLSSLGGLLANALQCSYGKLCGRGSRRKTCGDDDGHEFEEVCNDIL